MSPPLLAAIALAVALFGLWLLSLPLKNVSIVDPFWGMGFAIVAAVELACVAVHTPRALLAGTLVSVWGLRLSLHLLRRNAGHGEDFRYAEMRRKRGKHFPFTSLFIVFGLQGVLVWVIAWPVQAAILARDAGLGALDVAGAALWCVGFFFESVGDAQLAAFKRDPANRGQVMDRGLWRYTRHPNYFGDATMWWGLWLLACGAGGWWTVFGPALMTFLLLRVSGVALLEKDIAERRPGYRAYVRRTSAFFPRPPRRGDF